MRAFITFSKASGLQMNKEKSNIYMNGVKEEYKLLKLTGIRKGTLPFKYLYMPISFKKLGILDCTILVEKIVDRIPVLGSKHLSYGGRITLEFSLEWAFNYITTPLISWDQVCTKQEKGGMALRTISHGIMLVLPNMYGGLQVKKSSDL